MQFMLRADGVAGSEPVARGWSVAAADSREWWNEQLLRAADASVFQSFEWGEFKRGEGWTPQRFVRRDARARIVGLVQLLVKRLPCGPAVCWAPAGPVVRFDGAGADADIPSLLMAIRAAQRWNLVRFDCTVAQGDAVAAEFAAHCRRPAVRLNSGATIRFAIPADPAAFTAQMTSKHRYYVRKAQREQLRFEADCGDGTLAGFERLHRDMSAGKQLALHAVSAGRLATLRDALGRDRMTLLTGYLAERPVTACLTLDFGPKSFYFLAASGQEGRKIGAAYAMLPHLVEVLQRKGVREFDFGGISPDSGSRAGVDHFKKGFGGEIVETVGEWEWSNVPLLAPVVGWVMRYRGLAA